MENSDRDVYAQWLKVNRRLHRANLEFAAGVSRCLPEHHLLALARQVGQLQDDEGEALRALCMLRARRLERSPTLWQSMTRDRARVSGSLAG